jgi:hypothetical protein
VERKEVELFVTAAVSTATRSIVETVSGVLLAHNLLVRELIEQGILDKAKFLETIQNIRAGLAGEHAESFDRAIVTMAQAVLNSGSDQLPPDWLAKLLAPRA